MGKKLKQGSESIGSLIRSYREKANMTQKTLSEMMGYENPQFVSLIENGHSKVPLNVLGKVIEALRIPEKKVVEVLLAAYQREIMAEINTTNKRLTS